MQLIYRLSLLVCLALCLNMGAAEGKWVALFNGKNLEGWSVKIKGQPLGENFKSTFRVEDGMMKVGYKGYKEFGEQFGHIFYKDSFSHYRIRVEHRFVGEQIKGGPGWALRNSGIMLHCQHPKTMGLNQDFPVSIEVQLLGGPEKGKRSTANLCTPGTNVVMDGKLQTRHCFNSKSETYRGEQWVTVEVEVRGGEVIKHFVNGKEVMAYTEPQYDPRDADAKKLIKGDALSLKAGYISLQSESHPVEFRKVELMVLEK
ncbi:MAG: DUF1080 domain-containing protein [Verrucomicrobiales bacterium]|nr:DUF1080 domain-containing protein [Verrucomicrobiales bacterium]MBT6450264.1 DUF1080 domain-containing protein [Verrucomicrobiales bacterium]